MTPPQRNRAARAVAITLVFLWVVISVLILVAMVAGLVAFIRWTI